MNFNPYQLPGFAFIDRLPGRPDAIARIVGEPGLPNLSGVARLFSAGTGTLMSIELLGLPTSQEPCAENIFSLHIHETGLCSGTSAAPFSLAGAHYNPEDCPHPAHAGDLPPLFGFDSYAWAAFFTGRFTPSEVVGRSIIVHSRRDDFKTQPAGDSGARIACGLIRSYAAGGRPETEDEM